MSDIITSCIRERLSEDEITRCLQSHSSVTVPCAPLSGLVQERPGGGLGVPLRGFPCVHLHYFTPQLLLISFSRVFTHPTRSWGVPLCVCAQVRQSVSLNESILDNSISAAQISTGRALSYTVICWSTEHLLQRETERLQECDVRLVVEQMRSLVRACSVCLWQKIYYPKITCNTKRRLFCNIGGWARTQYWMGYYVRITYLSSTLSRTWTFDPNRQIRSPCHICGLVAVCYSASCRSGQAWTRRVYKEA